VRVVGIEGRPRAGLQRLRTEPGPEGIACLLDLQVRVSSGPRRSIWDMSKARPGLEPGRVLADSASLAVDS
jgi:hypothetical protein